VIVEIELNYLPIKMSLIIPEKELFCFFEEHSTFSNRQLDNERAYD